MRSKDADPGAKNEELKALLVKVRQTFLAHASPSGSCWAQC